MTATLAIETLTLFNKKADRLLGLAFFEKVRGGGAVVEFRTGEGWDGIFVGPDEESFEALVLTLRFFMQNNEHISLQNMRTLYSSISVPRELTNAFITHCSELNALLDSDSNLSIEDTRQLTYRDILHIFIYGTYAHSSEKYRRIFDGIQTTAFFPLFKFTLVNTLVVFARHIRKLRQINELAIKELSTQR